jgi:hypothetical protein
MGVELGKVLAKNILAQLNEPADVKGHDSSVSNLNLQIESGYSNVAFSYRRLASSTTTRSTGRNN